MKARSELRFATRVGVLRALVLGLAILASLDAVQGKARAADIDGTPPTSQAGT